MNVADDGTVWVKAHEVQPGDVLDTGAKVLAVRLVSNSFVTITYEWGEHGKKMHPGKNQLVALRSVVTD
jgi:hypothetical protein